MEFFTYRTLGIGIDGRKVPQLVRFAQNPIDHMIPEEKLLLQLTVEAVPDRATVLQRVQHKVDRPQKRHHHPLRLNGAQILRDPSRRKLERLRNRRHEHRICRNLQEATLAVAEHVHDLCGIVLPVPKGDPIPTRKHQIVPHRMEADRTNRFNYAQHGGFLPIDVNQHLAAQRSERNDVAVCGMEGQCPDRALVGVVFR